MYVHLTSMSTNQLYQLDRLVGLAMLIAATAVFLYYTIWTLLMVCARNHLLLTIVRIAPLEYAIANTPPSPSSTNLTPHNRSSHPAYGPSASPSFSSCWAAQSSAASCPSS